MFRSATPAGCTSGALAPRACRLMPGTTPAHLLDFHFRLLLHAARLHGCGKVPTLSAALCRRTGEEPAAAEQATAAAVALAAAAGTDFGGRLPLTPG